MLKQLKDQYGSVNWKGLDTRQLEQLRDGLKSVGSAEVSSFDDGRAYIELLRKFREAVANIDKLQGDNYPALLRSLLSVGEDGLYSNSLRFIFELIQNVDDCDFQSPEDCSLDMRFDFNEDTITLTYNEVGFTPFNVFAITGIAEAAKNVSSSKNEIGEKGIGFKSVFGVAEKVLIRSGWFSFELHKKNFTIPIYSNDTMEYCSGTQMTLFVPGRAKRIYRELKNQYCRKDALFNGNPLLFLNKLTSLKMYFDSWRCLEFHVSRSGLSSPDSMSVERDVEISVHLHDYDNGAEQAFTEQIKCSRYSYPVVFSRAACRARYGENTQVGHPDGKRMIVQVVLPNQEYLSDVGNGSLYSFLPTQLKFTVPLVCHAPFKLDASREFVDPQNGNLWFQEASHHLSVLIDRAYTDWKTIVKENIVQYIPGAKENLFAQNNGKEKCLSQQECFFGSHYLRLPLFFAADGTYHRADDVFCLAQEEDIQEPEKVCGLLGLKGALFVPPPRMSVRKFSIKTERDIKNRLFKRALSEPAVTSEALSYLDAANYNYTREQIPDGSPFALTYRQVETIFEHPKLSNLLRSLSCDDVRNKRRFKCTVTNAPERDIKDVLDADFDLSETPRPVVDYMRYCNEKCICLDIKEGAFLPCHNAIILSAKDAFASFAAFCYEVDNNDTFAIRVKLREASKKLDQYEKDTDCSPSDYLRNLCNVRLLIKDSLGAAGYKKYIDLIVKSGTDPERYIQELLQNADDCRYPAGMLPTFSLTQTSGHVRIEYNGAGFRRADIRSITAIGESTKNRLFSGEDNTIGEKGVGFKTIFAVASKVSIYSGPYAFALTDQEPTIPRALARSGTGCPAGTRMEIDLKSQAAFPSYDEKKLLRLCLCLRKLRSIRIGNFTISIEDQKDRRIITINKNRYDFKRFTHAFTVTNAAALKERESLSREISAEQTITCFVPEKNASSDYALYNGLPTSHKMKIPMAIDAPFALTTSREQIETGSAAWNAMVRKELYQAILSVMHSLKAVERGNIFRFARFVLRLYGRTQTYVNDLTDSEYLNQYEFLNDLKNSEILPTFDRHVFAVPAGDTTSRYPEAANILFRSLSQEEYAGILPSSIIDVTTPYDAILKALGCKDAPFDRVMTIISRHAERFIRQEDFRRALYEYLKESPDEGKGLLKQLAIIPVLGKAEGIVEYIRWADDSIFVKKGAAVSTDNYNVLCEKQLSKHDCERIFKVSINEMNEEYEHMRYNKRLKEILQNVNIETYQYLMAAFRSGALRQNDAYPTLVASEHLPLKNEAGEIVDCKTRPLFLCDQPAGYFPTEMIKRMIVHEECSGLAEFIRLEKLSTIHCDKIDYHEPLTDDDVESLRDDYFVHSEELLRGFYEDGLLSDELIKKYNLEYLKCGQTYGDSDDYDFPSVPLADRTSLRNHVRKLWQNPSRIISVTVERTVQKGQNADGSTFDFRSRDDAREGALRTYSPDGARDRCFCQMCKRLKPNTLIEVNHIDLSPKYYFPQLRIALCLECSKRFEALRGNEKIRKRYLEEIKNTWILNQGTVDIPIGNEDTLRFTATHLAEIQEILRQMPD